jgi:hypothetical protein
MGARFEASLDRYKCCAFPSLNGGEPFLLLGLVWGNTIIYVELLISAVQDVTN